VEIELGHDVVAVTLDRVRAEMEFLADDALVFAYEGVTRMQQGWVNAKKRKRRHRRAAADAARRKDETPQEPEPVVEGARRRIAELVGGPGHGHDPRGAIEGRNLELDPGASLRVYGDDAGIERKRRLGRRAGLFPRVGGVVFSHWRGRGL